MFGNFEFLCGAAFRFQLLGHRTPLYFDFPGYLIEADQRERIVVQISEVREHPAPNPILLFETRPRCYRLALILHAPQARRVLKPNAALAPFAVLGEDILGDENNPGGPSDELVLAGFGLRRDKRKQCAAIGRGDGYPPVTGLKPRIKGQIESELIQVES
jgi:hypothetical protein